MYYKQRHFVLNSANDIYDYSILSLAVFTEMHCIINVPFNQQHKFSVVYFSLLLIQSLLYSFEIINKITM